MNGPFVQVTLHRSGTRMWVNLAHVRFMGIAKDAFGCPCTHLELAPDGYLEVEEAPDEILRRTAAGASGESEGVRRDD
ncbi:MAG TPA: hypothetical protein VIK99_01170 [Thermaerobacter sp.]